MTSNSFSNPVPVAVAIVPCLNGKLLGIRRGIHPKIGEIAFPGGYINSGETFKQALSREVFEETGVSLSAENWDVFFVGDSLQSDRILMFGRYSKIVSDVDLNFKSSETQEIVLIDKETSFAFPLHHEAAKKFFNL